jgi:hypothetical protein
MKMAFGCVLIFAALMELAQGQTSLNLTNDVPITEGGMRMIIRSGEFPWGDLRTAAKELKAEAPVCWVLRNTSSNEPSVLLPRPLSCFVVDLKTTNGMPIAKTAKGRAMGAGPKSLTSPRGGRRIGPTPGHIDAMDFPRLTELFEFPSNGVYVLEVRCWAWSLGKKQFVLSPPVRVRVIRESMKAQPPEK